MKINYKILLLLITFTTFYTNAQELLIEGGKSITSFDFENSQGIDLENLQSTNQDYLSLAYRSQVFNEKIDWFGGVGLNSFGAVGSDNVLGNRFEWETTYLSLFLGLDLKLFSIKNFSFRINTLIGPEFIIQGTQTLNNQVFDIVGEEDFDTAALFLRGGVSFNYKITDIIGVFLRYRYGKSSPVDNRISDARLKLRSHDIGFGISINVNPKKNK